MGNFVSVKKLSIIFLLFIYGITIVGATIHVHYCMNRLISWGIGQSKEAICSTCGMEKMKSSGCCKDEQKQVKTEKEHPRALIPSEVSKSFCIIEEAYPVYNFNYQREVRISQNISKAPPGNSPPLYILNQVYRI